MYFLILILFCRFVFVQFLNFFSCFCVLAYEWISVFASLHVLVHYRSMTDQIATKNCHAFENIDFVVFYYSSKR